MGEIGARLADLVFVTSDNPRSEDPDAIIARSWRGPPGTRAWLRSPTGVRRSRRPSRAPARGRARGRRQGARAGQEFTGGRKIRSTMSPSRARRSRPLQDRPWGPGPREGWDLERIAGAAGAGVHRRPASPDGPLRATIDSRGAGPETCSSGCAVSTRTGAATRARPCRQEHGVCWSRASTPGPPLRRPRGCGPRAPDLSPRSRHSRAMAPRARRPRASVIAVTGSPGRPRQRHPRSLLAGQLRCPPRRRTSTPRSASPALLGAAADSEAIVLEMAMRGPGQIAS